MALRKSSEEKSPIDEGYQTGFNNGKNAYVSVGLDQLEAHANNPSNNISSRDIKDNETNPSNAINYTGGVGLKNKLPSNKGFLKSKLLKKTPLFTGGIVIIFLAIFAFFIFGPLSLLPALASNIISRNDTSSRLFRTRVASTMRNMLETDESKCPNTSKKFSCRSSRVSNKFLASLSERGIVANGIDSNEVASKKGYPTSRPTSFTVDMPDGTKKSVASKNLVSFLNEPGNKSLASKVFGSRGLLTARSVWSGKHIVNKFFKPFGIDRTSRLSKLANSTNLGRKLTLADFREQFKEYTKNLPGVTSAPNLEETTKAKIDKNLKRVGKAGPAYLIAAGGCVVSKGPSVVAAGITAIQLMQIIPIIQDIVLAPEGKLRASGVETGEGAITSEEVDMILTLLTEKTPRESDGKLTAAVDSIYLQQAMGINTGTTPVSEYAPGYQALKNPDLQAALKVSEAVDPACDVILSAPAMYTAMAVDVAVTVGLGVMSGGLLAGLKALGNVAISAVVGAATTALVAPAVLAAMTPIITDLAGTIPEAEGEALGDILGTSALTFFGSGSLSNMATVLRESDVEFANNEIAYQEQQDKEYDIASLSPFDTSSKYTFMGSVVNSLQTSAIINNTNSNLLSTFGNILKSPLTALSGNSVGAESSTIQCYGKDFGLSGDNPVCLNSAGVPVSYQTEVQSAMSTDEALSIIDSQGWIDESKPMPDNATLDELVESGYFKPDTLLTEWINTCGGDLMESGDYIVSADGCAASSANITPTSDAKNLTYTDEDGETYEITGVTDTEEGNSIPASNVITGDERAIQAITPALTSYIIHQTLNGENEEDNTSTSTGSSAGDFVLPVDEGYRQPGESQDFGPRNCSGCSKWHAGFDLTFSGGSLGRPVYAISSGTIIASGKGGSGSKSNQCVGGGSGSNNTVTLKLSDGVEVNYLHMGGQDIAVEVGDTVETGQVIGYINNCGQSYGAHLHFEVDIGGVSDPSKYANIDTNQGGYAPVGTMANPTQFMALYGVSL